MEIIYLRSKHIIKVNFINRKIKEAAESLNIATVRDTPKLLGGYLLTSYNEIYEMRKGD
jgi:hypothetical protein